jgi:hypothetical protein
MELAITNKCTSAGMVSIQIDGKEFDMCHIDDRDNVTFASGWINIPVSIYDNFNPYQFYRDRQMSKLLAIVNFELSKEEWCKRWNKEE